MEEVDLSGLGDESPFAGLGSSASEVPAAAESGSDDVGDLFASARAVEASPLPDDEKEDAMQAVPNAASSLAGGGAAAATGGGDLERLVQELQRRIAKLESRVDEVSDARERLERQVAAQTEELRVQRAAIARTQRAVRNLARPEEEGPTEPALRDPARPGGPRVGE